jgi:hypothetical protein
MHGASCHPVHGTVYSISLSVFSASSMSFSVDNREDRGEPLAEPLGHELVEREI